MTGKTGWVGGRNFTGLTWNALFGSELATLGTTNNVVQSSVIVTNGTGLDQLIDLDFVGGMAAATLAVNAGLSFWLAPLHQDNTTYGDPRITSTPGAIVPGWYNWAFIALTAGAVTGTGSPPNLFGHQLGLTIPPGSFKLIAQNQLAFALVAGQLYGRTYNQDLNQGP